MYFANSVHGDCLRGRSGRSETRTRLALAITSVYLLKDSLALTESPGWSAFATGGSTLALNSA